MLKVMAVHTNGYSPGQRSLEALSDQLISVEEDARHLSKQLNQMGFETGNTKNNSSKVAGGQKNNSSAEMKSIHREHTHDTITPFKAHIPDTVVLYRNYDALVTRLCRMESTVQGLRLAITQAQAERDLNKQEKMVANEKLSQAAESYEKEITRLKGLVEKSKKQTMVANEQQKEAEQAAKRLQQTLEEATKSQTTFNLDLGELRSAKSKLQRRIDQLKDELSRESSLRVSLEESHNTLLARVQQMEEMVQKEREEVQMLSANCNQLKRDSVKAWEEAKHEHDLRSNTENQLLQLQNELEIRHTKIVSLEEDKRLLMGEMRKLQKQYMELNGQIDNMTSLFNNKQHDMLQKAVRIQTEETVKQIEDRLEAETKCREQAEQRCKTLEQQVRELKIKLQKQEETASASTTDMVTEIKMLKEKMKVIEQEKEKLLQDKDNLLDEVNQAVDSMVEERGHLEEQLQQQKMELRSMEQRLKHAEEENYRLLQRLAAFEDQQNSQKHVQQAMTDMMEQKNKLAYDKGRLQSKVDQLQAELESLAHAQTDLTQAKRTIAALEANIVKLQSELSSSNSRVQRLETQLRQAQNGGDRKEKDFEMALKARDEAVKEASHLQKLIDALQGQERQRAISFEQSLQEVRQDNKKMASTLENVMQSHAKLQLTIEGLQVDLGRKDNIIAQLRNEKNSKDQKCKQLERELHQVQERLVNLESIESTQVPPLRCALEESQEDNRKLAKNVESLIRSNAQLQDAMEELNDQLQQKTHIIEKLQLCRDQDLKQHQDDVKVYEDRIENFKQQLLKEREKSVKKSNKEISELRRQLEDAFSKNGILSRANTELRHRITELEHQVKEQKDKILSLKCQIEHLQKIRLKQEQSIESLQGLREQLNDLEKGKNDYMKKTKEQSKMIQRFMAQISDLQNEIKSLSVTQLDMSAIIQKQECELQEEKKHRDQLKKKYKNAEDGESRRRERQLEELRQKTEEKLKEANNESLQISASLHDAHEWFKSKFDHLQHELSNAKAVYVNMKPDKLSVHDSLSEGKLQPEVTAEKATEMIQTSRQTISRLADYAEIAQQKTQEQLYKIQQQLLQEKARAEESEKKLRQFQDASLRHTEDLAKELDYLKNHSWILAET